MEFICQNCQEKISNEHINVSTDLAQCYNCKSVFKLSELIAVNEIPDVSYPPSGSKIILEKSYGDLVSIKLPAQGFTFYFIPVILFMIFWFGFLIIWTVIAASSASFMALFAIPFIVVGGYICINLINQIKENQEIIIGKSDLLFKRNKKIGAKQQTIYFSDIQKIKLIRSTNRVRIETSFRNMNNEAMLMPAILTGAKTIFFFHWANEAEQEWVIAYLNNEINKRKIKN